MRLFLSRILGSLLILLLAPGAWAGSGQLDIPVSGTAGATLTCGTTEYKWYSGATAGDSNEGISYADATAYYVGMQWTAPANLQICKLTFRVSYETGDISAKTYVAQVWSNSSGNLGTSLGTSAGVAGNNSWSGTWVEFTFSTPVSVTSGTVYHLTIVNGASDASNYAHGWYGATTESNIMKAWKLDKTVNQEWPTLQHSIKMYVME